MEFSIGNFIHLLLDGALYVISMFMKSMLINLVKIQSLVHDVLHTSRADIATSMLTPTGKSPSPFG